MRCTRAYTSHRNRRDDQLVSGSGRRWEKARVELRECFFGLVEMTYQKHAPNLQMPCVRGVEPVTVLFERHPSRLQGFRRRAQIPRHQREFGFGDYAASTSHGFPWAESACCPAQQFLGARQIAQL